MVYFDDTGKLSGLTRDDLQMIIEGLKFIKVPEGRMRFPERDNFILAIEEHLKTAVFVKR